MPAESERLSAVTFPARSGAHAARSSRCVLVDTCLELSCRPTGDSATGSKSGSRPWRSAAQTPLLCFSVVPSTSGISSGDVVRSCTTLSGCSTAVASSGEAVRVVMGSAERRR